MQKSFSEQVRSMTISEIVMTMVDGLKNPYTEIDMSSFGRIHCGICYGCAGTNTVCKILGYNVISEMSKKKDLKSANFSTDEQSGFIEDFFIPEFEYAINYLREGNLDGYNREAKIIGMALIPEDKLDVNLPILDNETHIENLQAYEDFANSLK